MPIKLSEMEKHLAVSELLSKRYGDLRWWPADSDDEVIIGAVLTQNTSWKNVDKSLSSLRNAGLLSLSTLNATSLQDISNMIRSSGFYNQKSATLKQLASRILGEFGSLDNMKSAGDETLTEFLLSLRGVGNETMESIMLYVLSRPVFVVDKYSERIFRRVGVKYSGNRDELKSIVERSLSNDLSKLKNYHAMLVQLAKDHCRKVPVCKQCPLSEICDYFTDLSVP